MDAEDATAWQGEPDDDDDGRASSESDYERACAAGYPAGVVATPASPGVVIGAQEGISEARWHSSTVRVAFLVGCAFGDDDRDEDLFSLLHDESVTDWTIVGTTTVRSGRVLLFNAACNGSDLDIDPEADSAGIGDALSMTLPPGEYVLAAREFSLAGEALYNVVRWTRK